MNTQSLDFLTAELSAFRGEFYGTILQTTPALLAAFDESILGGYSMEREEAQKGTGSYTKGHDTAYWGALNPGLTRVGTDKAFVQKLGERLQKADDPVAFMYGVRNAFMEISALATESDEGARQGIAVTREYTALEGLPRADPLALMMLSTITDLGRHLEQECTRLRGIYEFMRTAVREKVMAPDASGGNY